MAKPETKFRTNQVQPFLNSLPRVAHFSIQQKSLAGHPDKLICIRGTFIALELKSEDGKLAPLQTHFLNLVDAAGGWALVARPSNWPAVRRLLSELVLGEVDDQAYVWDGFEPRLRECTSEAEPDPAAG